jgi:hypothetical protein
MLCILRRREAVQLKLRILCVQRPQQIFVPLDIEIRMQSALHQHAVPPSAIVSSMRFSISSIE